MRIATLVVLAAVPLLGQQTARTGLKLSGIYADAPSILADSDSRTYYLYTTTPPGETAGQRGVLAYRSRDLQMWDGPRLVFTVPEGSWADAAAGVVSAKVQLYRGRYYLLATLRNKNAVIEKSPPAWRETSRQATQIFVGDSPEGPFKALSEKPPTPDDFMTLDGSLYVEGDLAYFVYAHDWNQVIDGGIEAVQMKTDLSAPAGEPFQLFRGSAGPWLKLQQKASREPRAYVTEAPFLHKTKDCRLFLMWSSRRGRASVEAVAYSLSGKMEGPWRQRELVTRRR